MLRIGQIEGTATQEGKYTDGSVAGGVAATRLRAAAFNAMQEELAHIVEEAGIALDVDDMAQVLAAIRKLTLNRSNPFGDIKADGAAAVAQALANLGLGANAFGFKNCIVFDTAGVTNWAVPDELKNGRKCKVTVIGGGGSGGRNRGAGGGGGGGKAEKYIDLTGVDTVPITVGAGGTKPAAGTAPIAGNPGGTSSFGTYCSATGGWGGGNVTAGTPGIGVNGDINTTTGPGSSGAFYDGTTYTGGSGGGAGGQGSLNTTSSDGADAIGPGGGGAGAAFGATAVSCRPGAGFNGLVMIEW